MFKCCTAKSLSPALSQSSQTRANTINFSVARNDSQAHVICNGDIDIFSLGVILADIYDSTNSNIFARISISCTIERALCKYNRVRHLLNRERSKKKENCGEKETKRKSYISMEHCGNGVVSSQPNRIEWMGLCSNASSMV